MCFDRLPYDFYNVPGTQTYYFIQFDKMNALEARKKCLSYGADLTSILSQYENDFIFCKYGLYKSIKEFKSYSIYLFFTSIFKAYIFGSVFY